MLRERGTVRMRKRKMEMENDLSSPFLSWMCGGDRGVEEMGHKAFKIRRSNTQQKREHTDT